MRINLIQIGNSKGIRIPQAVIKECGFGDQIDLRIENGSVVLTSTGKARAGWDEAFGRMSEAGDDALLLPDNLGHSFDEEEWEW